MAIVFEPNNSLLGAAQLKRYTHLKTEELAKKLG